ncbi:MAG: hypothetical protein QM713_15345 [Arachnia sp.]
MSNSADRGQGGSPRGGAHTVEWRFDAPGSQQAEAEAYRVQFLEFQRRGRYAFLVRVATTVLAVLMLALGVALTLGSLTMVPGSFLAQRYVPGADGSISILRDGNYALTSEHGGIPRCVITDLDGVEVPQRDLPVSGGEPHATLFHATEGGYHVTCEGGNDGVVAFAHESLDLVRHQYFSMVVQALPFLLTGIALFYGGKYAAARIRPESKRPIIPS